MQLILWSVASLISIWFPWEIKCKHIERQWRCFQKQSRKWGLGKIWTMPMAVCWELQDTCTVFLHTLEDTTQIAYYIKCIETPCFVFLSYLPVHVYRCNVVLISFLFLAGAWLTLHEVVKIHPWVREGWRRSCSDPCWWQEKQLWTQEDLMAFIWPWK